MPEILKNWNPENRFKVSLLSSQQWVKLSTVMTDCLMTASYIELNKHNTFFRQITSRRMYSTATTNGQRMNKYMVIQKSYLYQICIIYDN